MDRLMQDPNTGFYDLPCDFWQDRDAIEDEYWEDEPEDEEIEELSE